MKKTTTLLITLLVTLPIFCQTAIDSFYRTGSWWYSTDPPHWQTRIFKPKSEFIIANFVQQTSTTMPLKECGAKKDAFIVSIELDACLPVPNNFKTVYFTESAEKKDNAGSLTSLNQKKWWDIDEAKAIYLAAGKKVLYDSCNIYTNKQVIPIVRQTSGEFFFLRGTAMGFFTDTIIAAPTLWRRK